MREIKYRGKCAYTNKWKYSDEMGLNHFFNGFVSNNLVPDSCCQYTGIKDKNGREIYEGDIFKAEWEFIYIIDFLDGSYWLKDITDCSRNYLKSDRMEFFDLIGDIYENPELLNVTS